VLRDGDELLDNHQLRRRTRHHRRPAHQHRQIANTQITNNSAGYGGAISLRWSDPRGNTGQSYPATLLDNVAISSNRGSYGGGAIYCRNGWISI
jgi:predicted outer membrane repeat protein